MVQQCRFTYSIIYLNIHISRFVEQYSEIFKYILFYLLLHYLDLKVFLAFAHYHYHCLIYPYIHVPLRKAHSDNPTRLSLLYAITVFRFSLCGFQYMSSITRINSVGLNTPPYRKPPFTSNLSECILSFLTYDSFLLQIPFVDQLWINISLS